MTIRSLFAPWPRPFALISSKFFCSSRHRDGEELSTLNRNPRLHPPRRRSGAEGGAGIGAMTSIDPSGKLFRLRGQDKNEVDVCTAFLT